VIAFHHESSYKFVKCGIFKPTFVVVGHAYRPQMTMPRPMKVTSMTRVDIRLEDTIHLRTLTNWHSMEKR